MIRRFPQVRRIIDHVARIDLKSAEFKRLVASTCCLLLRSSGKAHLQELIPAILRPDSG